MGNYCVDRGGGSSMLKKLSMGLLYSLIGLVAYAATHHILYTNDKMENTKCAPQFAIAPIAPATAVIEKAKDGSRYWRFEIHHVGAKNTPVYWYAAVSPKLTIKSSVLKLSQGESIIVTSDHSATGPFKVESTFGFSYQNDAVIESVDLLFPIPNRATVTQDHHGAVRGLAHIKQQEYAVDIDAALGTPIYASKAGVAAFVEDRYPDTMCGDQAAARLGNDVTIRTNDGFDVSYGHVQKNSILVKEGQAIREGQMIARVGASGAAYVPHLHISASVMTDRGLKTIPIRFVKCGDIPLVTAPGMQTEINGPCYETFRF